MTARRPVHHHRSLVAAAAVTAVVAAVAAPAAASVPLPGAESGSHVRVAGDDRIATAIAVSQDRVSGRAPGAVLASAADFADALAGAALADHVGGPLLLTGAGELDPRVSDELRRRLAQGATVHLLGGSRALAPGVEDAVSALGFVVRRVQGADRYATAAAVVDALPRATSCDVLLASGTGFADGAAASGVARAERPLLFTAGDQLPPATAEALSRCAGAPGGAGRITAVGGGAAAALAAVSGAAAGLSAEPVVGADRYDTSAKLLAHAASEGGVGTVVLTSGLDYPDALVGGTYGAPVVLTQPGQLPAAVAAELATQRAGIGRLLVVGGRRSVADSTAGRAVDVVRGTGAPATPAPVAGAPAGISNRSGLPWNSGVYFPGPSRTKVAQHQAFADWRARPVDVSVDWLERSSWEDVTDSGWLYRTWSGTPQTKVLGVGMLPEDDPTASLASCAAGDYDVHWAQFGRDVAAHGLDDEVVVRLGWEFNGDWYRWTARDPRQWAECWRRVHGAAESTAPALRWSWDVNRGRGAGLRDAREAYPGDAYVDIVGVDSYDGYPAVVDEASWQVHYAGEGGLRSWADFAAAHGKPLAVPEWGVYPGTAWAGHSGGDNPLYVEKMAGFFAEVGGDLAYEAYFNQSAPYYAGAIYGPTLNPRAAEAYRARW